MNFSSVQPKISDPSLALEKLRSWCAYQERCQQEARDKLYELGLWPEAIESIIASLIEENFLNEERFAAAYARGKFRIKHWGKQKIKIALKQKRVSEYCIKKSLSLIDGDEYLQALEKVAQIKLKSIKETHPLKLKFKLTQYLMSRGFERDLIEDVLRQMDSKLV